MKLLPILALCLAPIVTLRATPTKHALASPDGRVTTTLIVSADARLQYSVGFKGRRVIEPSALGITVGGVDLGRAVKIGEPVRTSHDETYPTRGAHAVARNHYNQWSFPIEHPASGRHYTLQFRLYNDGAAYRYLVPGRGSQHVNGESSSWTVTAGTKVWYFERLTPGWKLKSYAGEWLSTDIEHLHTATPPRVGPVQGTPLVLELPGGLGYGAITKAALYNYSGMRLEAVGNRTVVANFTEGDAGFDVEGAIVTPWRVTLLVDDLNALVNSDLITNLNPPPDPALFADTRYIKPGRSVWSWESIGLGTPEDQRQFIDLAAELGFEYSTIDAGWKDWDRPWETVRDLATHAKAKGVRVFVWVHSKDIRDPADNYRQLHDYLDRVAAAGVAGIKTDFMDAESKAMIDYEITTLREAARRQLLVNFHGCHASTGEERTFPNEITREGIRGIEVNKMKEGPLPAWHNAALPFTRFIVGHADYTPLLYTNPGPTTHAHQLATLVAFRSSLQTIAEHPETLLRWPVVSDAVPVLKAIPTVWDETIVLPGSQIGQLAALARRHGSDWSVGILNGGTARDYSLDLSFLPAGHYTATLVRDDLDAAPVDLTGLNARADLHEFTTTVPFRVSHETVNNTSTLKINLANGGGFVARFTRPSPIKRR